MKAHRKCYYHLRYALKCEVHLWMWGRNGQVELELDIETLKNKGHH